MLLLEKYGPRFTHENIKELWLHHLPIGTTFGPERVRLLRTGIETLGLAHRLHWLEKGGIGIPELITTTDDPENSLDIFLSKEISCQTIVQMIRAQIVVKHMAVN